MCGRRHATPDRGHDSSTIHRHRRHRARAGPTPRGRSSDGFLPYSTDDCRRRVSRKCKVTGNPERRARAHASVSDAFAPGTRRYCEITFSHPDCNCRRRNYTGSVNVAAHSRALTAGGDFHPAPKVSHLEVSSEISHLSSGFNRLLGSATSRRCSVAPERCLASSGHWIIRTAMRPRNSSRRIRRNLPATPRGR